MTDKFDLLRKRVEVALEDRQVFMTVPVDELLTLLGERDYLIRQVDRAQVLVLRNQKETRNLMSRAGQPEF